MRKMLVMALATAAIAGCGGSATPTVCHVYPGAGSKLVYRPAGCEKNLAHETLAVETVAAPAP